MDDVEGTTAGAMHDGGGWPTAKQRFAVQQAVGRLLDALAPERAPARGAEPVVALLRHRSPRGCILQAATRAVTVSWFPSTSNDAAFGELQVIAWRGTVSRPGSAKREAGAVPVLEALLHPVEVGTATWAWRAGDDTVYDTAALAARCQALVDDRPLA